MNPIAKSFIFFGLVLIGIGLVFALAGKVPWIGRLPGDISIKREHFSFYFPLTTCILVSVVLSLILYLFRR